MTWEVLDTPVDRTGTGNIINRMPEKTAESGMGRAANIAPWPLKRR
jgi:hypothetical protein